MNLLEQTKVGAGTAALVEDVERSDGGRGRTFKIPRGHYLFEVSFVFRNKALFAKHRAAIDSVVASLMVEPQG